MKRLILFLLLATILVTGQAEAATLTTQIARTREMLFSTDSSNSVYSDTLITEAINTSQDLLSNLLSYSANFENVLKSSCAYVTGSVSLTSPTGFKKIITIYDAATYKPYIQVKPEEAHRLYSATTKDPAFLRDGGTIKYFPASTASGTLEVVYLKAYTTLSSGSDTITVQARYLNILTLASVWYILQADNQQARAGNIYKLLTDLVTIENNAMINTNVIERVQGGK
jgi:outer membrane lipoprotein-sorting protein